MPRPAAHLGRVLAWLVAGACATHAGEVTQSWAPAADQSKLTAGAALMTDYIYRGSRSRDVSRAIGKHITLALLRHSGHFHLTVAITK